MKIILKIFLIIIILINIIIFNLDNLSAKTISGGDVITNKAQNKTCTAGYNAVNPATGQNYLVTAGHCFKKGEDVYDKNTMKKIGTVEINFLSPTSRATDIEFIKLIDNSNNPYIFDGQSEYKTPVVSYMSKEEVDNLVDNNVNRNVRKYDYFTFSKRTGMIYPLSYFGDLYISTDEIQMAVPFLDFLVKPGSSEEEDIRPGVSGAPVYKYTPAGIELVGIVKGGYVKHQYPDPQHVFVHPVYYSAPIYKPQTI